MCIMQRCFPLPAAILDMSMPGMDSFASFVRGAWSVVFPAAGVELFDVLPIDIPGMFGLICAKAGAPSMTNAVTLTDAAIEYFILHSQEHFLTQATSNISQTILDRIRRFMPERMLLAAR